MKNRGRTSIEALLARPQANVLDRVERPVAPFDLVDEEVEVWAAVVNALPADYFGADSLPLLSQYARHVIQARRIASLIEQATADPDLGIKDYARLLMLQARESAVISSLATKMRIAQQSTRTTRSNPRGGRAGSRPWES